MQAFAWKLWVRKLLARGPKPACSFFLGHTRFATSSAPTVPESHPHRFSPPKNARVWRRGPSGWLSAVENFEVYVTHNGDLDYWPLFGVQRTQRELGAWLKQVVAIALADLSAAAVWRVPSPLGAWLKHVMVILVSALVLACVFAPGIQRGRISLDNTGRSNCSSHLSRCSRRCSA